MASFREFLRHSKPQSNPQGDFVRDARADRLLPTLTSWEQLRSYLKRRHAVPEAYTPAYRVWQNYQRYQRRASK